MTSPRHTEHVEEASREGKVQKSLNIGDCMKCHGCEVTDVDLTSATSEIAPLRAHTLNREPNSSVSESGESAGDWPIAKSYPWLSRQGSESNLLSNVDTLSIASMFGVTIRSIF